MDYEARRGFSRKEIRVISQFFRKLLRVNTLRFPVIKALDLLEAKFGDVFYYVVEEDAAFPRKVMAVTDIDENGRYCIRIRESVYLNALKGDRASLGFICHEECHFILVYLFNAGPKTYRDEKGVVLARVLEKKVPLYLSMEWQAKALCGETMIPYEQCRKMTFKEITKTTLSSDKQTEYFLEKVVVQDE